MNADPCASAPNAFHRLVPILENVAIARDTYRLRLGDADMARTIKPGQFVMIRPGPEGATDPLLGRPAGTLRRGARPGRHCRSRSTSSIWWSAAARPRSRSAGRASDWPCGGRSATASVHRPAGPVVFVAGGIGQTPFLALGSVARLARRWPLPSARLRITLLYGVRTAALLAGVDDFRQAGIEVELATDDGTAGHHGFVTELLARRLERGDRPAMVVGCGPPAHAGRAGKTRSTISTFPATSRSKTTWRAASVRASVASRRFARPTARPTSAGCASRDRSCRPIASTGAAGSLRLAASQAVR